MFSNSPAPKALLVIPLILFISIILLSGLVIQNLTPVAKNETTNKSTQEETKTQNRQNTKTQSPPETQSSDVMFKAPIGNYPANKCPEILIKEGSTNNFAIDANEKYSLSSTNAAWISANCPNTETLTF